MTEQKIFQILLPKPNNYDFPKLNENSANIIANKFTNIIYDTLKLKSVTPTNKRLELLKFLSTLAGNPDKHYHINESNYSTFIQSFKTKFEDSSDLQKIINKNTTELHELLPRNLYEEVQNFYKRKNQKHKKKIKRLETIKKYDQESLSQVNFSSTMSKVISYYETSESVIKNLLKSDLQFLPQNSDSIVGFNSNEYRENQIKYAYALVHFSEWTNLRQLINKLTEYETLEKIEINFLLYLTEFLSDNCTELRIFLIERFPFVYEKPVIEICTKIIQEQKIIDFEACLVGDVRFHKIKQLCKTENFKLKISHLLFALYSYSYCNSNVLKFMDFLFEK